MSGILFFIFASCHPLIVVCVGRDVGCDVYKTTCSGVVQSFGIRAYGVLLIKIVILHSHNWRIQVRNSMRWVRKHYNPLSIDRHVNEHWLFSVFPTVGFFISVSSLKVFGHSIHSERRGIYPGKSLQALQNDALSYHGYSVSESSSQPCSGIPLKLLFVFIYACLLLDLIRGIRLLST